LKGILFTQDNRQKTRDGIKTQTRRLAGLEKINREPDKWQYKGKLENGQYWFHHAASDQDRFIYNEYPKPRYQAGNVVYLKEGIKRFFEGAVYVDDNHPVMLNRSGTPLKWRWQKDWLSPLHLPEEAARTFIKITDVQPQRLQAISEDDAVAEGYPFVHTDPKSDDIPISSQGQYQLWYQALWDSLNPVLPWDRNPFVWRDDYQLFVP
jgi:hypothetical protein